MKPIGRRGFLKGAAAGAGVSVLTGIAAGNAAQAGTSATATALDSSTPTVPSGLLVSSPTTSDRQGFNKRFWAGRTDLQIIRPSNSTELLAGLIQVLASGVSPSEIQVTSGRHCYEGFVYTDNVKCIVDCTGLRGYGKTEIDSISALFIDTGYENWNATRILNNVYKKMLPGGSCYSVGLGGHITGGGYGLWSRAYGLTVDYLIGVDIVVIDSASPSTPVLKTVSVNSADPDDRDLAWAVRGGGGASFGIITRLYFDADKIPDVPEAVYVTSYSWDWHDSDGQLMPFEDFNDICDFFFDEYCNQDVGKWSHFGVFVMHHMDQKSLVLVDYASIKSGETYNYREWRNGAKKRFETIVAKHRVYESRGVGGHMSTSTYHLGIAGKLKKYTFLEGIQTLNGSGPNQYFKTKSAYHTAPTTKSQRRSMYKALTTKVVNANGKKVDMSDTVFQHDSYGGMINQVGSDETAIFQRNSICKIQYQTYWDYDDLAPDVDQDDSLLAQAHINFMRDAYTSIYKDSGGVPALGGNTQGCYFNYPDTDIGTNADSNAKFISALSLYFGDQETGNVSRLLKVARRFNPHQFLGNAQGLSTYKGT